jgi:uncharacterized repeat protein (TIGR01451 family)
VGSKRVVEVNETGITFSLAWMNTNNPGPVRARITDTIPPGTSFADGSLACEARGVSITTRCEFEPAANRIVWEGTIAPDPGVTDPDVAQNEIFIMLRVIPEPGVTEVTNQADSTIDTDDDGDFTDEPSTTPSDQVTWTPQTGPPSLEISKIAAPFIAGPGDEVTWTIAVTNRSAFAPAYNVSVSDNVPNVVTIINVSASKGTYTFSGRSYTFNIGAIGPNETVLIHILVRVRDDIDTPVLITNVAILNVGDQVIETTQSSVVRVTQLPETGQSPYSEPRHLLLGMLTWGLLSAGAGTVVLTLARLSKKTDA